MAGMSVCVWLPPQFRTSGVGWGKVWSAPLTKVCVCVQPQPTESRGEAQPPAFGKCAACHSQATAAKGKGFVLIGANGKPRALNALELLKLSGRIEDESMPPKGSPELTDDEAQDFREWIYDQSKALTK